jgi:hypothetical protein
MPEFRPAEALKEHMLEGHPVTLFEAILLFGVQNPNAEFTRIKKAGFLVQSRPVSMTAVLRRVNQYATCSPPPNLPHKEIFFTEYWIQR